MARRSLTLLLVPLLAACATTPPSPAYIPDGPTYLQGVSSKFSVRIDELRPDRASHREQTLPNAVMAGDETLSVAASLFRHGEHFTMDMVVQNHSSKPFQLHRTNIQLLDDMGNRLVPEVDWEGARHCGLRAKSTPQRDYATRSGIDLTNTSTRTQGESVDSAPRKPLPTPNGEGITTTSSVPGDLAWLGSMGSESVGVVAPEILNVKGGANEPYWVYWHGEEITYPLTAIITIDRKRLLFKFDEP